MARSRERLRARQGHGGSTDNIDVSIVMKVAKSCVVDRSSPRIQDQWHTMVKVTRSSLGGLPWSKHRTRKSNVSTMVRTSNWFQPSFRQVLGKPKAVRGS